MLLEQVPWQILRTRAIEERERERKKSLKEVPLAATKEMLDDWDHMSFSDQLQ